MTPRPAEPLPGDTRVESEHGTRCQELEQVLSESPFARVYNLQIDSLAAGECTLVVPFDPSLERPGGIVAGSILMTAADVAMWLAIMTRLGKDAAAVTSEMSTTFLSPARQEDVCCTARVVKLGKNVISASPAAPAAPASNSRITQSRMFDSDRRPASMSPLAST